MQDSFITIIMSSVKLTLYISIFSGAISIFWCVAWWFLVYDSPAQHPRISEDEKVYILEAIGDKVQHSDEFHKVCGELPSFALHFYTYDDNDKWTKMTI